MSNREKVWFFIKSLNRVICDDLGGLACASSENATDPDLTFEMREAAFRRVAELIGVEGVEP